MSIVSSNIISNNIVNMQNNLYGQSTKIQKLIDIYSSQNISSYDQVTKQNVTISFDQVTQRYRFEIQKNIQGKENDMLMYQVWKKNNADLNSNRKYKYISLKDWVNIFKTQKNFTPTTLIEIDGIFYPTVMVDASIENTNCVFYFDVREIRDVRDVREIRDPLGLPKSGSYNDVRFDIDSIWSWLSGAARSVGNFITKTIPAAAAAAAQYLTNTGVVAALDGDVGRWNFIQDSYKDSRYLSYLSSMEGLEGLNGEVAGGISVLGANPEEIAFALDALEAGEMVA